VATDQYCTATCLFGRIWVALSLLAPAEVCSVIESQNREDRIEGSTNQQINKFYSIHVVGRQYLNNNEPNLHTFNYFPNPRRPVHLVFNEQAR